MGFQFYEVGGLVIIHKRSQPNLTTRSERKVENFRNCIIFLQHARISCLNLANSDFFFPQNMVTCFLEKNPFGEVATGFLFITKKNLPQEKTPVTTSAEKGW
jgi:hypothetical protein